MFSKDQSPTEMAENADRYASQFQRDAAEFTWTGKPFISHTSPDTDWCEEHIVRPIRATSHYWMESCFFLSNASDSKQLQYHLMAIGLSFKFTKTIIVAISNNSLNSAWMRLETRWAIEQSHPVIICLRDDTDPAMFRQEFAEHKRPSYSHLPIEVVDFRKGGATGQLLSLLEKAEFKPEAIYYYERGGFQYPSFSMQFDTWRKAGKPQWRDGKPIVR
jgi:hypothetical protein